MRTISPATIAHSVRPVAVAKPFTVADQIDADVQRLLMAVSS